METNMIKKIWNGPVTEFFGGRAKTWVESPADRTVGKATSNAIEPPYEPKEATDQYKEILIEPVQVTTSPPIASSYQSTHTTYFSSRTPNEIKDWHTTAPNVKDTATKHDTGKTDWSLVPWDAVEEIIKVLQFGAGKYSPWNWAENGGFKFNRLFNSSMRHFVAWFWRREDNDPETGLSHMAHLGCNVLFLLHYVLNGNKFKNNDNRPNVP